MCWRPELPALPRPPSWTRGGAGEGVNEGVRERYHEGWEDGKGGKKNNDEKKKKKGVGIRGMWPQLQLLDPPVAGIFNTKCGMKGPKSIPITFFLDLRYYV